MQYNQQKGLVTTPRVTDARRVMLFSLTRALQTTATMAQLEREESEFARRLDRIDDRRRLEVLQELETSEVRLATLRSRLQTVGEKMLYAGLVRSQLVRGKGNAPEISIVRDAGADHRKFVADEDTALVPGDVIEVALPIRGIETQQ